MSKPSGIADLSARVERLEYAVKILDGAAEHYEQLGPELRTFADTTLPKRLASIERAAAALMQADDPTARFAYDLSGMFLERRPALSGEAVGKAARAVHDALSQLRGALKTYAGCVELAAGAIPKDAAAMREHGQGARRQLEAAKLARSKVARSIALEMEAVEAARRELATERSGDE